MLVNLDNLYVARVVDAATGCLCTQVSLTKILGIFSMLVDLDTLYVAGVVDAATGYVHKFP
jgi:hypothetical protein